MQLKKFASAAALACVLAGPAMAEEPVFLVFHVVDGHLEARTSDMWVGKAPEPGVNCAEDAVVKPVVLSPGPEGRNPNNYLRTSSSVIFSPPVQPAETP